MFALKHLPMALFALVLIATHYWSYRHGLEHERGLQATSDNAQLIQSTKVMADAFAHTNTLLQELNDGSPDNQDIVPPGLALTFDGLSARNPKGNAYITSNDK